MKKKTKKIGMIIISILYTGEVVWATITHGLNGLLFSILMFLVLFVCILSIIIFFNNVERDTFGQGTVNFLRWFLKKTIGPRPVNSESH